MGDEKSLENYVFGSKRGFAIIKYAGIFDFADLIARIKKWSAQRYYGIGEKEHAEAVKPSGKDILFEFEGERKVTDYVKFEVIVKITILRLIDVIRETSEGKERKQQAEVEVGIKAWMVKNYKDTFKSEDKSKIQEFFRQIYERFIAKRQLDNLKGKLVAEVLALGDEIKSSLNVPRK